MSTEILYEILVELKSRNANEAQLLFFRKAIKHLTVNLKSSHRRNMRVLGLLEEEVRDQLHDVSRKEAREGLTENKLYSVK